jgi:rhamnosyltransferase
MQSNCCAVVVSYNPTSETGVNVNALIGQVAEVVVIDNGSAGQESLELLAKLAGQETVTVKYNPTNVGIAAALNQGVRYAINQGYEWVATFDQDSLAPSNFIQTMLSDYENFVEQELVVILAPKYQMNGEITSFASQKLAGKGCSKIKTTITSGNLIKVNFFEQVGFFEESFFIDYVDHEFCLRVRSQKLLVVESQNAILGHNLGDSSKHQILAMKLVTTGHAPIRRYYKYRNLVRTFKKYYWFEPLMLAIQFKSLLIEPVKILLWETNKWAKVSSIYKGLLDGILQK